MPSSAFESAFDRQLKKDPNRYALDRQAYKEALEKAGCVYGGQVVKHLYRPTVYAVGDQRAFCDIVGSVHRLMEEAIDAYKKDPAFRAAFGFDGLLERLILTDPGYDLPVPITRTDLFYQGPEDFSLCEINTDGTSGMLEAQLLDGLALECQWQEDLNWPLFQKELIGSYTQVLLDCYRQWSQGERPQGVAIVDFPSKTQREFEAFQAAFEVQGFSCQILSPEDLTFDGRVLRGPEGPVDLIYRRLVTSDLMDQAHRCQALIEAVLSHRVCLVGGFQTQVPHNKKSFALYHQEAFAHHFSKQSRQWIARHIPFTAFLDAHWAGKVALGKDRWVLKPADRYATKGVVLGIEQGEDAWNEAIEKALVAGDYLVQAFCPPPERSFTIFAEEGIKERTLSSMVGLFTYAGAFAGVLTRLNDRVMIAGDHGGSETASLFERNEEENEGGDGGCVNRDTTGKRK